MKLNWSHYFIFFILALNVVAFFALLQDHDTLEAIAKTFNIFFTGTYTLSFNEDFNIFSFLAITGLLTELFILIIFLTISIRYILSKDEHIRSILAGSQMKIPVRQILLVFFLSTTIISTIVFKYVENTTWLNAVYYIVVTITTVGYGDLVATQPITKVITIILIVTGISFIGLASQYLVDRIIRLQLDSQLTLPTKPLGYKNHIVIGGYGAKGRRLAQLFIDRQIKKVVVVEKNASRSSVSINRKVEVISGDITKPNVLKILNIDQAQGLFLVLSDDNQTIQTGILARSLAPELNIYAELSSNTTYNIARYAGINKPISQFHYLINVIRANLYHQEIITLDTIDNMKTYENRLGYVYVPLEFDHHAYFENALELGIINTNLNEFSPSYYPSILEELYTLDEKNKIPESQRNRKLLAIDKEELIKPKFDVKDFEKVSHKRVIFAGYPEFVDEFIARLGLGPENAIILWQNQREREAIENKEYVNYEWTLETGIELLERLIKNGDMVICTFDDITSSMVLGVTLKQLQKRTHLVQLVPYEYEIESLVEIGADAVVTPQRIISEALLTAFTKTNFLAPSQVFTNGHLFEHLVYEEDPFDDKIVQELEEKNIMILYIQKLEEGIFREALRNDVIRANDRLVVYIKY
ncbi:MAG: NAD-binding protein [Candidatus Heimdallarchaeota archaeon]|nr:NAD-binding protein [Candidatus Heimdallarchaeota archaeon]